MKLRIARKIDSQPWKYGKEQQFRARKRLNRGQRYSYSIDIETTGLGRESMFIISKPMWETPEGISLMVEVPMFQGRSKTSNGATPITSLPSSYEDLQAMTVAQLRSLHRSLSSTVNAKVAAPSNARKEELVDAVWPMIVAASAQ